MSELLVNLHLIVIVGLIFTMPAHSMRFDLGSGTTKCISEDIKSNAMTVGKYSVINPSEGFPVPDTHKITVRVMPSKTHVVTIFLSLCGSVSIFPYLCMSNAECFPYSFFFFFNCMLQSLFLFLFSQLFFFFNGFWFVLDFFG